MTVFIIRRIMQSLAVVMVMSFIVFGGVNIVGDPVEMMVSDEATQEEREKVIRSMGLDKPWYVQYGRFVAGALEGNLGKSFWVGLMFIMVFAVILGWLPSTGRGDTVPLLGIDVSFLTLDGLAHLFLPALNLALFKISLVIRLARAGTREVVHQDYIKFARAKGLRNSRIVLVHLMKNIMIPVVTVLGLEFGGLIAFSVVTETVFAWPGMGKLIIDSIQSLDRPVIVAYLMIIVLIFVIINLVVDVLYSILDPRVRLSEMKS